MSFKEISSDILVIHQNRVIFSSGKGHLTQNSKISATVTQVLTLFSQKIMEGERIHFIRFEKHRMIFLFPQDRKDDSLVAIVLIPFQRSARQVIPAMAIILRMLENFLQGNILDVQNRHIDCFYQILCNPEETLIIIPRSAEGILSALVILTAFAHDMQYGIQQIASNIIFVDPNNQQKLSQIAKKALTTTVLSFVNLPEVEENDNVLVFGLESELRQYFSAIQKEKIYDVISRIFGEQSNAAKMKNFISNDDAQEIAQSVSLFPESENDFIRNEILLNTVIQPGKDIIVTMSAPVMLKLRQLAASETALKTPAVEEISSTEPIPETPAVEEISSTEPIPETPIVEEPSEIPEDLAELTLKLEEDVPKIEQTPIPTPTAELQPEIELVAEPDAIPTFTQESISKPVAIVSTGTVSDSLLKQLDETRKVGHEYRFSMLPLVLDVAPYELNIAETQKLPFNPLEITIRIYPDSDNQFIFHVLTKNDRLSSLKDSLDDLSVRVGGETHLREDHVSIVGPIEKRQMTLRALLWLGVIEYLTQVEKKIQTLTAQFKIPKEGSILVVPPKRDFVREKLPTKFRTYVEEATIRTTAEKSELWTLGKAQEDILSLLLEPLRQGEGVVFVSSNFNVEMEEIALFLLIISEICGIGFSRW